MFILQPHFEKELVIPVTFLTTGKYEVLDNNLNLEKTWNDWTVKDLLCFVLSEESDLWKRYRNIVFHFPQLTDQITCQAHGGHLYLEHF